MGSLIAKEKKSVHPDDNLDTEGEKDLTKFQGNSRECYSFKKLIDKTSSGALLWEVVNIYSGKTYAIKEYDKARLVATGRVNKIIRSLKVQLEFDSRFIQRPLFAFQDKTKLYLVLNFLPGETLEAHLNRKKRFTEEETRFIIGSVLLALEHIHSQGKLHTRLTPACLMFEVNGYVSISHVYNAARMGISIDEINAVEATLYTAPEIILRRNEIGPTIDFYSIGTIAYQIMTGQLPYGGITGKALREKLSTFQLQIKKSDLPEEWSIHSADFINKLLQRKPEIRLGYHGIKELKMHSWLRSFPWQKLEDGFLKAPFIPKKQLFASLINKKVKNQLDDEDDVLTPAHFNDTLFADFKYP